MLAAPTFEQDSGPTPLSPCPNVFTYEPNLSEKGRWYGNVNLSTKSTLPWLWLNIVLDNKADILATDCVGEVSTTDNKDFHIENGETQIYPSRAVRVRFFVNFNLVNPTPKLQAIRVNGREICNANTPQPAVNRPDIIDQPITRPIQRPEVQRPSYEFDPPRDSLSPVFPRLSSTETVLNIPSSGENTLTPQSHSQGRPTPPVSDDSDYSTGPAYIQLPNVRTSSNTNSPGGQTQSQCGKPVLNAVPLVVNGKPTLEGQWPWHIALYQHQRVDNKYRCGGTLVSHKHVITAAHCVTGEMSQRPFNQNTLTVYLGKHNLMTSVAGVQIRFVKEIFVNPNYNARPFTHDVAILELNERVTYSDWVQPACLWPDDKKDLWNVIGKKGTAVGWGFDETGVLTEELNLVEMLVVSQMTCLTSHTAFFSKYTSEYTYCAGNRDGSSVCNGDSGGGMVFRQNGVWYLRGLVSLSATMPNEYRCDPTQYAIFTDLAKLLPWIYATVSDF